MKYPVLAMLCALVLTSPAISRASPAGIDGQIEHLKPGEYFWAPQISPAGPVTVIVSLATQRAYAYRNGVPIGVSTVSSGAEGYATPTGIFTILQKDIDHVSNEYSDAPMPYMQRLTWGGIALHAGNLPGYPASHGCIRMPRAFAQRLYGITKLGMTVVVTDKAEVPIVAAAPAVFEGEGGNITSANYRWVPDKSPTGPVSIVISGRDRRIVVLRNGVEIGSSPIVIDGVIEQTSAFTLRAIDAQGQHWLRLPLPGAAATGELSPADQGRGRLPAGFRSALATVLAPGVTLLVTRETLRSSGTGRVLTVVAEDGR